MTSNSTHTVGPARVTDLGLGGERLPGAFPLIDRMCQSASKSSCSTSLSMSTVECFVVMISSFFRDLLRTPSWLSGWGGGAFIEKVGEGLLERGGTESCVLGSFRDLSFCYLGASIALATLFILDAMFLPLSRLSPALSKSIDPLALLYLCSHPYVADLNIEE